VISILTLLLREDKSLTFFSYPVFPQFSKTVLCVASDIIRFMFKPLDPGHYHECREVFDNLSENLRVQTSDDNFLSLFALGINAYTQRHRDMNDITGGLSGLFTLGRYTGKSYDAFLF
jgi:hypothetical protein